MYLNTANLFFYLDALGYVIDKTEGKLDNLPQHCTYTLEQLLDITCFPENLA